MPGQPMPGQPMPGQPMQVPQPAAQVPQTAESTVMDEDRVEAKRAQISQTAHRLSNKLLADDLMALVEPVELERPAEGGGGGTGFGADSASLQETDAMLGEWMQATRNGDFQTADRIRSQMFASGMEPDRPGPRSGPPSGLPSGPPPGPMSAFAAAVAAQSSAPGPGGGPASNVGPGPRLSDHQISTMMNAWAEAKRAKDFGTADRIRNTLRENGIEPDPPPPPGSGGGGKGFGPDKGGGKGKFGMPGMPY
eukprot:gnl/TRDRNA2_/TRDRNA2_81858_c0_seq1.p1 gnl/TRDRNA2_/TRDRNA2_81858_c0~~gnl/TRDRNA2_/TRDRNA2_81858_c0_seq1.p1  ORF type:complete len:251 (-),score=35.67 gnl/TRDRNA2_/TRDRNA2_81858_c0_seq1:138-890(-)